MKPTPEYGDLFTIEEFIKMVNSGSFIDYDGSGNYSNGTEMTDIEVWPSDIAAGNIKKEWSHVVWFNR